MGSRTLEFVLRGDLGKKKPAVKTGVNQNAISSFEMKMAQKAGLEPATKRLTAACSTD